jgi:hypothetical protein
MAEELATGAGAKGREVIARAGIRGGMVVASTGYDQIKLEGGCGLCWPRKTEERRGREEESGIVSKSKSCRRSLSQGTEATFGAIGTDLERNSAGTVSRATCLMKTVRLDCMHGYVS